MSEEDAHYPGAEINAPDELDFNDAVGEPDRACDECGKVDMVALCISDVFEGEVGQHLCFDCAGVNGFCFGCGNHCAGITSFDFSPIQGYCENCVSEIRATVAADDDDDDDEWMDEDGCEDDEDERDYPQQYADSNDDDPFY